MLNSDDLYLAGKIARSQGAVVPRAWYREHMTRAMKAAGLSLSVMAAKTYEFYRRALRDRARDLYSGAMSEDEWLDYMIDTIADQLTGAFRAGLREVDAKMTDELQEELDKIIQSEYDHVLDLGASILEAKDRQAGMDGINSRLDSWAERWNDTKDRAILLAAPKDLALQWVYGDTEHCETCQALNGVIAYAGAWNEAELKPQSPPNEALECGGWRCQCRLEPTDEKPSEGNIPGTSVPCDFVRKND